MVDSNLSSGLPALVKFALKSNESLSTAVQRFQDSKRSLRELKERLQTLDVVLNFFDWANTNLDTNLTGLELPLFRCGKACLEFEEVILSSQMGPKSWVYMGNTLERYTSTFCIAIGIGLSVIATNKVLKDYKELITNTTSDLEEHLEEIEEGECEEKNCTKQCLHICTQASEHMSQVQINGFEHQDSANQEIVVVWRSASPSLAAHKTSISTFQGLLGKAEEISKRCPSTGPSLLIGGLEMCVTLIGREAIENVLSGVPEGYGLSVKKSGFRIINGRVTAGALSTELQTAKKAS